MRKKQTIMFHMHQIRDFIDDRYSFYNNYFHGVKPKRYQWKGVEKAFSMGSAIDFAIKSYYLTGKPNYNTKEFNLLPEKIDKITCVALVNSYILKYEGNEFFHDFKVQEFKIPLKTIRDTKYNYCLIGSPDLLCETYHENELALIEIKTAYDEKATTETLDFQTMFYCWASRRWNFKIPKYVIKRTIYKPRIKQKKNESDEEFKKRIILDTADSDKYFKSLHREIDKSMVDEFEKYLYEIIKDLDSCLKVKNNKYRFYKRSDDVWP